MLPVYIKLLLAFIFSAGVLVQTNKIAPRFYTLRFISGYYCFQFIALCVYLTTDPVAKIWSSTSDNYFLREYIDDTIIAYFICQIGLLFAAALGYLFFFKVRTQKPFNDLINSNSKALRYPLYFTAFVVLTYPIFRGSALEYPSAILFNYLNFIPFVAGLLFFEDKWLRYFWILALIVLFVLGIMTGGRGAAFTSTAMYAFGFYFALEKPKSRRIAIVFAIIVAIPLSSFMAFVGIFRHIVGRVDFDKINWDRAVRIYEKYEKIKDSKVLDLNTSDGKLQSWGRLVNFVNIFQFASIPSKRDHLGWDGLFEADFYYSFDISFISGTTLEDRFKAKAGNYRLNDYGYLVTPDTSVEYSIVTEGFIRFGYLGIFLEALILGLFSQLLEYLIRVFAGKNTPVLIFSIVMLCQVALYSYAYNLFVIMRMMILSIVAAYMVVIPLQFFQMLFKSK